MTPVLVGGKNGGRPAGSQTPSIHPIPTAQILGAEVGERLFWLQSAASGGGVGFQLRVFLAQPTQIPPVQGYRVTRLHGYKVTGVQGYRGRGG